MKAVLISGVSKKSGFLKQDIQDYSLLYNDGHWAVLFLVIIFVEK